MLVALVVAIVSRSLGITTCNTHIMVAASSSESYHSVGVPRSMRVCMRIINSIRSSAFNACVHAYTHVCVVMCTGACASACACGVCTCVVYAKVLVAWIIVEKY